LKSSNQVLDEGNRRIKEIFEKHKEFSKIENLIASTQDVTNVDVETISNAMSSISAYLCTLSGIVPRYTAIANASYIYRKFAYMWEFRKMVQFNTVKEKEQEALDRTADEHFEEVVSRYVADYIKNKYDAYERHVSILQTRIGLLKNEMFRQ